MKHSFTLAQVRVVYMYTWKVCSFLIFSMSFAALMLNFELFCVWSLELSSRPSNMSKRDASFACDSDNYNIIWSLGRSAVLAILAKLRKPCLKSYLAPRCGKPLRRTWVISTRFHCNRFGVAWTSLVWKFLVHASNHACTEHCSELSACSTLDWTL